MSDKNNDNRIDTPSDSEDLSSLISSAIENKKNGDQPVRSAEIPAQPPKRQPQTSSRPQPGRRVPQGAPKRPPQGTKGRPIKQGQRPAQSAQGQRSAQAQKSAQGQNKRPSAQKSAQGQNKRPSGAAHQGQKTQAARPNKGAQPTRSANSAQHNAQRKAPQRPPVKPVPKKELTAPAAAENTAAESETEKKAKWSKKKKTGVALAIIFIVFFLLLGFVVFMFFHYTGMLDRNTSEAKNYSKPTLNSSEFVDESDTFDKKSQEDELKAYLKKSARKISNENVINILLIGEDLRDTSEDSRGNTDVMLIISINKEQKTITMTSLMRDMYIYMSEFNYSYRLNAAYHAGGCEYLEECIEDYFQIEIDRYVRVSFQEFITVVDTIGGIDMKVSDEEAIGMHDPMAEQNTYLGNSRETDWLWEGGDLHLNGNQALAYARLRYVGNSDWERTERQRKVLKEVITKGRELSLLKINSLLNEVLPNVHTDLTDGEIASLLVDVFDILDYDIQEVRIPADGYYSNEIVDNMDVLLFNYNANAAIIQKVVYGDCKTVEEAIAQYQEETGDFYAYNSTYDPSYNPNYNNTNW